MASWSDFIIASSTLVLAFIFIQLSSRTPFHRWTTPKVCIGGSKWDRFCGCLEVNAIGEYFTSIFGLFPRIYIGNWHWVEKARDHALKDQSFSERIRLCGDDDEFVLIDTLNEEYVHHALSFISHEVSCAFDNLSSSLRGELLR